MLFITPHIEIIITHANCDPLQINNNNVIALQHRIINHDIIVDNMDVLDYEISVSLSVRHLCPIRSNNYN